MNIDAMTKKWADEIWEKLVVWREMRSQARTSSDLPSPKETRAK